MSLSMTSTPWRKQTFPAISIPLLKSVSLPMQVTWMAICSFICWRERLYAAWSLRRFYVREAVRTRSSPPLDDDLFSLSDDAETESSRFIINRTVEFAQSHQVRFQFYVSAGRDKT